MDALVFAAAVAAAAGGSVAEMPAVIVEASRLDPVAVESARFVEVMDAGEITDSEAKSLPAVLARSAGVDVWHVGAENPALMQITMRGYGENGYGRVLVNVDGDNLANPDMSAANYARIPVGGVDHVEILHGPQTVLYGDGASAGVINVVTDGRDCAEKTYGEIHGGSFGAVGGAAGTCGRAATNDVVWRADLGYDRSDGYRDNSAYDLWNARASLRRNFSNGAFIRLSTFFSDADFDLPGPLSSDDMRHDPRRSTYADHGGVTSYGVDFAGKGVIDDENELDFTLSFSQRDAAFSNRDYTDIYGTPNRYRRDYDSDTYMLRFAPRYCSKIDILGFGNEFLAGSDSRLALLDGRAHDVYPDYAVDTHERYDISRWTIGGFARDEFFFTEGFSAVAGVRLERDWNRNNVAANDGCTDNFAAGEAALEYRPIESAKLFLRWCRFYRNPFIDEYRWRSGERGTTAKPETGWNAECGGEWAFAEEFHLSGAAYYSETENEIHYNPFAMSNENSPWLHRRQGVELAAGWEREKVAALKIGWSGVLATKAEGIYAGNWIPGVPRQILNAEGRVWVWDEFDVFGGYRLVGARYAISDTPNANGRMPAEGVFRLGCRYRPTWRWFDGFVFSLVCENVMDNNYCNYAVASVVTGDNAYYPSAGRSFMFTIRYEF